MSERSQYQYTQVQGPVWREPVASRMQWLPQAQQPARGLPPNRLGDFARPEFAALYKPEGLQWLASDRYSGRAFPRVFADWSVYPQLIVAAAYDPQNLEWQARDSYFGRALARSLNDASIYPLQPPVPYDPQNLEWMASGAWQPARSIAFIWQGSWVCDPTTPVAVVPPPAGGGGILYGRAERRWVISKPYIQAILGEEADEETFLESVAETFKEAEQPAKPQPIRELGALSALDAITHAYNVHFETVGAARAAINERLVEFEDDDLMAVLMILAMADEP